MPSNYPTNFPSLNPTPIPTIRPSPNPTTNKPTVSPTIGPHTHASSSSAIVMSSGSFTRPADFTEQHERAFAVALVTSSSYLTHIQQITYVNATRYRGNRRRSLLGTSSLEILFTIEIILEYFGMSKADDASTFATTLMQNIGLDMADAIDGNTTNQKFGNAFNAACRDRGVAIINVTVLGHSLRSLASGISIFVPVPSTSPTSLPTVTVESGSGDRAKLGATMVLSVAGSVVAVIILVCVFVGKSRAPSRHDMYSFAKKAKISGKKVASVMEGAKDSLDYHRRGSFSIVAGESVVFEDNRNEYQLEIQEIESKLGDEDVLMDTFVNRVPRFSPEKINRKFERARARAATSQVQVGEDGEVIKIKKPSRWQQLKAKRQQARREAKANAEFDV